MRRCPEKRLRFTGQGWCVLDKGHTWTHWFDPAKAKPYNDTPPYSIPAWMDTAEFRPRWWATERRR